MTLFTFNIIRLLLSSVLTALVAFVLSRFLVKFLYKIRFWKKNAREKTITGQTAEVFYSLNKEREVSVPRGGGLVIWLSVSFIIFIFLVLSKIAQPWWFSKLDFFSRPETWLPLFTLVIASIVGLLDDIFTVYGKGKYVGGGIGFLRRLLIVIIIGFIGGFWFYFQLGWDSIHIPLLFNFPEGIDLPVRVLMIPIFIFVMVASWASGVVDGLDGLSGGIFASIFAAFSIIAFSQGKIDLAIFCAGILGALFSFLWFNIPPAKFYMGETGILGLTSVMAVVAFLTDSVLVLPVIGGVLVLETGSVIIQLLSKKFRHKKIWLSTPIHHHFEARGWRPEQITMRFWIIGAILAVLGVAIRLLG